MGWSDNKKNYTPEKNDLSEGEKMWMELYHRLSNETRQVLITSLDSFDELNEDQQQMALRVLRSVLEKR